MLACEEEASCAAPTLHVHREVIPDMEESAWLPVHIAFPNSPIKENNSKEPGSQNKD